MPLKVHHTFHVEKLTVVISFAQGTFTPAEVEGLTVEHVFSMRRGDDKPNPLANVPAYVQRGDARLGSDGQSGP